MERPALLSCLLGVFVISFLRTPLLVQQDGEVATRLRMVGFPCQDVPQGLLRRAIPSLLRNPVEAGLVTRPWDYPWSIAGAYACGQTDPLLAETAEYLALSPEPVRRQQVWREFLVGEDSKEEVIRQADWALGDADFRRRVLQEQGRPAPRRRGHPPKPG